ncbi:MULTISPECIES: HEPN domain-containing protein [Acinetobacter]|uniref:HEPN domain-containing protein n=2 Tax=Acinetobacter TaxID=469 RepID=A0A4Q7AMJ5_9GAMM|nr:MULTISPECIES: HEPN domain-containing protein [Acinetobacter]MCW8041077.1 HEPN domain-containing protein [Acinetobacter entericus]RZG63921.1 HEPN domain-containing protein [Acinetobacter bouvetii]
MDSIEFLSFSKKIISLSPLSEIDFRQAVSRSYYCAFHQVNEKAISLGIPVNAYKGGTHRSLRETLIALRPANNKLKGIAFKLNNFHILRVESDYKLDVEVTDKTANVAIQMCEKIINDLDGIHSL